MKLPAQFRPHWLASAKGEAIVATLMAIPTAALAIYDKVRAEDATQPVQKLFDAVPFVDPKLLLPATASLEKLRSIAGGLTPALVALACIIVYALYRIWAIGNREKHHDITSGSKQLMGPLFMLDEAIRRRKGLDSSEENLRKFRCTLHRVDRKTGMHEQYLPYVGYGHDDPDRMPGPERRWSNHTGLVGEVVRTGGSPDDACISDILEGVSTAEEYADELVKEYSYDRKQAKAHLPMRLQSLAVPINDGDPKNVIAVLYCDSSEREFFDEDAQNLCICAASSIATYIRLMA